MKNFEFIAHLLNDVQFDNYRVIEFVNAFAGDDTDNAIRILSYLTYYEPKPKVAIESDVADNAKLISYDFFADRVTYRYIRTGSVSIKKDHVDDVMLDGVYESRDAIPHKDWSSEGVKVEVKYWDTNYCSLKEWNE